MSNRKLNSVLTVLSDTVYALFPQRCAVCRKILVRSEEICCVGCLLDFPLVNNYSSENPASDFLCGRFSFEKASSFFFYHKKSSYAQMLHKLKYQGQKHIGLWLGKLYGEQLLASGFLDGIDAIVPVPVHKKRLKQRGYNQSKIICEGISSVVAIPVIEALQRVKYNASQVMKSHEERWLSMQDAFLCKKNALDGIGHVLLVDDVITTGATIEMSVCALQKESAVTVSVCSIALVKD